MTSKIALSIGDPCGIGAEITLKSLSQLAGTQSEFTLFAPKTFIQAQAQHLSMVSILNQKNVSINAHGFEKFETSSIEFSDKQSRAHVALTSLKNALAFTAKNPQCVLVTAPLDKSIIRTLNPTFTGHTEYLAEQTQSPQSVMLLANDDIACALLTHHISLRDVPLLMTQELLIQTVTTLAASLKRHFSMENPSFCLAGLNPHAGEISENSEEETIFKPAINTLRYMGIEIDGPFPADSLYPQARKGSWDVIISPYHDQGLVAVKYPGLHTVVNITCGLPFLRVSPGHGTAYDIAGKGIADARSMIKAIEVALKRRIFP